MAHLFLPFENMLVTSRQLSPVILRCIYLQHGHLPVCLPPVFTLTVQHQWDNIVAWLCLVCLFGRCWVLVAARAFFQLHRARATLSLQRAGFSLQGLLLLWGKGSRHAGSVVLSLDSGAQARQLWHMS